MSWGMKILVILTMALSTSMTTVPEEYVARHECAPVAEVSCLYDTPLVCPPGYLDGCITGESAQHTCLLKQEGPSCNLEIQLNCPQNFQDGCLSGETKVHTCVPVRGELCQAGEELTCPAGFEDSCVK